MKKNILLITLAITLLVLPRALASRTMIQNQQIKPMQIGKASWYSRQSPGIKTHTANNEIFDDEALTCAIWWTRFDRKIRVTNLENGKSIIVRVNDRGPSEEHVLNGRIIDLTKAAFRELDCLDKGLIDVKIEFL